VLDHVPVRAFGDDRCGPGSLSVVLNALGDAVSEEELAANLPRAPGGGVLSVDLLLTARQRGFSASLVTGDEDAVRHEIQEGRPVILMLRMLNAPGRAGDVYHYVVVDGHDPGRSLFRIQFGDGKARWAGLDQLEGAWNGGGHAMVSVSAPLGFVHMRAALELERAGRLDEAAERYTQVLEVSPESLRAWVNLGNVEAGRGRPQDAERAYRRALSISPDDPDALNNLAWLLLQEGSRLEEAEALARGAARRRGPDQALVLDTLARIPSARGRCTDADATYAEALALPALPPGQRTHLEEARREAERNCRSLWPSRKPGAAGTAVLGSAARRRNTT
jgi:tetratricopeptide (TPR) repeat protein